MARLIDADLLLEDNTWEWFDDWGNYTLAGQAIADAPTADAAPVVHAEWTRQSQNPDVMQLFHEQGIGKGMGVNSIFWTCSECKSWGTPAHNYCQNCGAKMDGGKK